ncbi:hypothetical protein, partial [Cephaloticoccus primus]|uniref:hypothetical protein n=1 Tax=Cephaloticoccus primus TaxID=1548207 RepID=UPI001E35AB77
KNPPPPPPPPEFLNHYKKYNYDSFSGAENGPYRHHACWIGKGVHAGAIPVIKDKVVLNRWRSELYVKDITSKSGGIYTISVENPVGHAGVIDFAGVGGVTLFFND